MNRELLKLVPKRYLCPYCGEWHPWESPYPLEYYDSSTHRTNLGCKYHHDGHNGERTSYYFKDNNCYCKTEAICTRGNLYLERSILIEDIDENSDEPRVTFSFPFTARNFVCRRECSDCISKWHCLICKLGDENGSRYMDIKFGFEFEQSDYNKLAGKKQAINSKKQVYQQPQVKENKEETTMKKGAATIWEQLYEHSPKENVELVKQWVGKYKPTLRWALPVVSIYAAYHILNSENSKLTVENVDKVCKSKLGYTLDYLKDKKALRELITLGGAASAYAAIKGISAFQAGNIEEISPEEIEDGMEKLDAASKRFSWIQPKTEAMLPIAVSVIIVYLMTQKSAELEKAKEKVSNFTERFCTKSAVYFDMVKLFVADKLHVNLEDEEEVEKFRKFAFLAGILGIIAFIYGKDVLLNKETDSEGEAGKSKKYEKIKELISQIMKIMKKLMPTAFAAVSTFLITEKVLERKEIEATDEETSTAQEEPDEEDN